MADRRSGLCSENEHVRQRHGVRKWLDFTYVSAVAASRGDVPDSKSTEKAQFLVAVDQVLDTFPHQCFRVRLVRCQLGMDSL